MGEHKGSAVKLTGPRTGSRRKKIDLGIKDKDEFQQPHNFSFRSASAKEVIIYIHHSGFFKKKK